MVVVAMNYGSNERVAMSYYGMIYWYELSDYEVHCIGYCV